jgi:hypothetical protein
MIESKVQSLGVDSRFKILHDRIITPGDGLVIFQGMIRVKGSQLWASWNPRRKSDHNDGIVGFLGSQKVINGAARRHRRVDQVA